MTDPAPPPPPPQVVEGLGASAGQAVELYPVFMASLADLEDEVCSNAVYGLGVLAANAHAEMHRHAPLQLCTLTSYSDPCDL